MKAIVYHRYGSPDVLEYVEREKPRPADDQVLIKIRATTVNPYDRHYMRGEPHLARIVFGLRKPKDERLGVDVAGVVEAAGKNVTAFKAGDEVFGSCRGSFAEYGCASPASLALKPKNMTFEQAACANVAGVTALQALRDKAEVQPGQKVLINGAAGGVGTFAVQIAKSFGAEVTGVCSTRNVEMLQSIGADHAVDYTTDDFTASGKQYDVIVDCVANHSLTAYRRALTPNGAYVLVGGRSPKAITIFSILLKTLVLRPFVSQRLLLAMTKRNPTDRGILRDLMEAGKLTPVIDRSYPLAQLPEAIRYLETGHVRGKVGVRVG